MVEFLIESGVDVNSLPGTPPGGNSTQAAPQAATKASQGEAVTPLSRLTNRPGWLPGKLWGTQKEAAPKNPKL